MIILGLDPGSLHTGFGLLEKRGSEIRLVEAGRFSPSKDLEVPQRLARLVTSLRELLERSKPEVAVIETPFFGMNARSLIVLAQARGALLAAVALQGIEIREVSPAEVKSAVTGNGRADKAQVAHMVRLLLGARDAVWPPDATDALAVALCGAQRLRMDRLAAPRKIAK
jgi:crossover junction endodeoxyribonuclease RuvC